MRLIICDRCGKKVEVEEMRKSITIGQKTENGGIKVIHCDRIHLTTIGQLHTDILIDLCDNCKESFVNWYGKVGIYER